MILIYLRSEKGSILDPIVISWLGYIIFVSAAMFFTGYLFYDRPPSPVKGYAAFMIIVGTITYTIGLYTGKADIIRRCIPTVSPTLNASQIWLMLISCFVTAIVCFAVFRFLPYGLINVVRGITNGAIGALSVLSILVILSYRGRLLLKLVMLITLAAMCIVMLQTYYSRRPMLALLFASFALIYYRKARWWSRTGKMFFLISLIVLGLTLVLFLSATRGERFMGAAPTEPRTFSEKMEGLVGGSTINYIVYEYIVEEFPERTDYLYGKGYVPGFLFFIPRSIWPSKPIPSGQIISRLWLNTQEPSYTVGATGLGELYMNFGILGILLGSFIVGKVVRGLNEYWRSSPDNIVLALAWFIVVPDFASVWRGDFTSMTAQGLTRVGIFFGFVWLAKKLSFSTSEYPSYWYGESEEQ